MKTKTQSQSKGKTALLRLRCTEVEKAKIAKQAERAGKTLSEYAREAFALYFDPRRGITPRVYEVLNLPPHDSQV